MKDRFHSRLSASTLLLTLLLSSSCSQVDSGKNPKPKIVETLLSSTRSWDGALYTYPDGQAKMTLLRIRVPKGFRTPVHTHPQPGLAYVVKGTLECVVTANKTLIAKAGQSFPTTYGNVPHYCENIGKEDGLIYVVYAGAEDLPVTVPAN